MSSSESVDPAFAEVERVFTPRMERRNRIIFVSATLLLFLAVPVIYVGPVQAALCQRLGASNSIANLPSAANLFGQLAPFFLSSLIAHRHERLTVVLSNAVTSVSCLIIAVFLTFDLPASVRIAVLVGQGLLQGFTAATSLVFMYQCLGRGMSVEGRSRTLKHTFTVGPLAAVAGSLFTQYILNHGFAWLEYPYDFAFIYLYSSVCTFAIAIFVSRYELIPVPDDPPSSPLAYLKQTIIDYMRSRIYVRLWIAYALWYCTYAVIPNLGLFSREVLHRNPEEVAGLIMALRFGGKSVIGYLLGVLALRYGIRAPLVTTVTFLGFATLLGWVLPGYGYLFSFVILGGGELGGAYFPNYIVSVSPLSAGVRNLSLLTLATPVASLGAIVHGALADRWGFPASFLFGIVTAGLSLLLVLGLPTRPTAIRESGGGGP